MIFDKLASLFVILNFGSLMLLSFLNQVNIFKVNKIANRLLGVYFLLWAFFWVDEIVFLVYGVELNQNWQLLLRGVQYFTPILFYFTVVFYSNPSFKFKKAIPQHLILPIGYIILLYFFAKSNSLTINYILIFLMLSQTLFYTLASYYKVRKHQKVVMMYSSQKMEIDLS
ncbi:MAG: hypothetical protein M0D57_05540 [Sphingobacteriales bacterium JAD_PAG50586_3]|nr:MAG: hypothetical protein M0D57_05540 [Sphingobacteriales bacterium JAD_PAG50586_3]